MLAVILGLVSDSAGLIEIPEKLAKWVPVTDSIVPWIDLNPWRVILVVLGLALLFRERLSAIVQRAAPRVSVTWGNKRLTPGSSGDEGISARKSVGDGAEPLAPRGELSPFQVGLAPDFRNEVLLAPQPMITSESMRTQIMEIGILVQYSGAASARDVSYFYTLDPSTEGHPMDDAGDDGGPEYARHPITNHLVVIFKRRHHHPGTIEHHTIRVSFPFEQRCQEVIVAISWEDHQPARSALHLLIRAGFPHRISTVEELTSWRCRLGKPG